MPERKISPYWLIPVGLVLGVGAALGLAYAARGREAPEEPSPGLATLYGKVNDAATGQPIGAVSVSLWSDGELLQQTFTDSGGAYSLKNILPGGYLIRFEKADYETVGEMIILEEGLNELNVSLTPIAVPQPKFYMPAKFTRAKITSQWDMPPYYYVMEFECPITNNGDGLGTQIVFVGNDHPGDLAPWSFELTLQPGETYLWKHTQLAIWPMKFYLEGDWVGDNYSEGIAT